MFLEIGTVAGAITGAFVSVFLPASALFILFGVILLYATTVMIRARGVDFPANVRPDKTSRILALGSQYEDHSLNRVVKYEVTRTPLTVFIGYFARSEERRVGKECRYR